MKKGYPNYSKLDMAKFLGAAKTVKKYAMYPYYDYKFPCAIKEKNLVHLKGELYEIYFQDQIKHIDQFEGVPNYYTRENIEVLLLGTNDIIKADIYFFNLEKIDKCDIDKLLDKW
jgi:gamma-glutamylcyclotransferase (GGCT)/AIG2-like uncharacterized protein YtfP